MPVNMESGCNAQPPVAQAIRQSPCRTWGARRSSKVLVIRRLPKTPQRLTPNTLSYSRLRKPRAAEREHAVLIKN